MSSHHPLICINLQTRGQRATCLSASLGSLGAAKRIGYRGTCRRPTSQTKAVKSKVFWEVVASIVAWGHIWLIGCKGKQRAQQPPCNLWVHTYQLCHAKRQTNMSRHKVQAHHRWVLHCPSPHPHWWGYHWRLTLVGLSQARVTTEYTWNTLQGSEH